MRLIFSRDVAQSLAAGAEIGDVVAAESPADVADDAVLDVAGDAVLDRLWLPHAARASMHAATARTPEVTVPT